MGRPRQQRLDLLAWDPVRRERHAQLKHPKRIEPKQGGSFVNGQEGREHAGSVAPRSAACTWSARGWTGAALTVNGCET